MTSYVAYYRVSTKRQGDSGLGLEAQQAAVRQFAGNGRLIGEFTEVESGGNNDRQQLAKALQAARLYRATLVVAKFDRLSRNAAFLITLRDSGVKFVAVDMPEANNLTVGIMALVAENEAEAISARTKAALQAAKARGVKLGGNGQQVPSDAAREAAKATVAARVAERARDLKPILDTLRGQSLRAIAAELTSRGIPTSRGGSQWNAAQVQRVLAAG